MKTYDPVNSLPRVLAGGHAVEWSSSLHFISIPANLSLGQLEESVKEIEEESSEVR